MYQTNTASNFYKGLLGVLMANVPKPEKWVANGWLHFVEKKSAGKYVIIWRGKGKVGVKIESVNETTQRVTYTVLTGKDKGNRFNARYEEEQHVRHFDTLKQLKQELRKK